MRTKLAGEVSVGPWLRDDSYPYNLAIDPETLIFDRRELDGISVLGFYLNNQPRDREGLTSCIRGPEGYPSPFVDASNAQVTNFSSAPLQNIILAKVFREKVHRFCKGLVFEYGTGAQRALGDCRLGVEPYQTYTQPQFLCIRQITYETTRSRLDRRAFMIQFPDNREHGHEEQDWRCLEMSGVLQLWFTHEAFHIDVQDGKPALSTMPSNPKAPEQQPTSSWLGDLIW